MSAFSRAASKSGLAASGRLRSRRLCARFRHLLGALDFLKADIPP
jgi:hypothetical protein